MAKIHSRNGRIYIPYLYDQGYHVIREAQHDPENQVFSYTPQGEGYPPGKGPVTYHYHIAKLYEMFKRKPYLYRTMMAPIDPTTVAFIAANNGVEWDHELRMTAEDLERPGILMHWSAVDEYTMLDGNHRYVFRHMRGMKSMPVWAPTFDQCKPAMLDIPPGMLNI